MGLVGAVLFTGCFIYSLIYVDEKTQVKDIVRHQYKSTRIDKRQAMSSFGKDLVQSELSCTAGSPTHLYKHFVKTFQSIY